MSADGLPDRVGILGVGHLTSHIVPGLISALPSLEILLSPRSAARADTLAREFGLAIASDNDDLVGSCDCILIGTRPHQTVDAISGLPWHEGQTVISLCAGLERVTIAPHLNGATLVRAMPVIAAQFGDSPTCMFPENAVAQRLFDACGTAIVLDTEESFDVATVNACFASWLIELMARMQAWNEAHGLEPETARPLATFMTRAAGKTAIGRADVTLDALMDELTLDGSVTGAGLDRLRAEGAIDAWPRAFNHIYKRMLAGK